MAGSLSMLVAIAAACAPSGDTAKLMPKNLSGVSLGMTREELKTVRPNAHPAPDIPASPTEYESPIPDSPFFSDASYAFANDRLASIDLVRSAAQYSTIWKYRPTLIYGALRKWGTRVERYVAAPIDSLKSTDGAASIGRAHPVLVWRKRDATIAVSYTPSKTLDDVDWLQVQGTGEETAYHLWIKIMTPSHALEKSFSRHELTPASQIEGADFLFSDVDQILQATAVMFDNDPFE